MMAISGMTRSMLFVALAGFALAGCNEGLSGTYLPMKDTGNNMRNKIEFSSGGTAYWTIANFSAEPQKATYKVEGNKVHLTIIVNGVNGFDDNFTMDDKGCLTNIVGAKYCKN